MRPDKSAANNLHNRAARDRNNRREYFLMTLNLITVIARLDRAIPVLAADGYWIARSSRAMTAKGSLPLPEDGEEKMSVSDRRV